MGQSASRATNSNLAEFQAQPARQDGQSPGQLGGSTRASSTSAGQPPVTNPESRMMHRTGSSSGTEAQMLLQGDPAQSCTSPSSLEALASPGPPNADPAPGSDKTTATSSSISTFISSTFARKRASRARSESNPSIATLTPSTSSNGLQTEGMAAPPKRRSLMSRMRERRSSKTLPQLPSLPASDVVPLSETFTDFSALPVPSTLPQEQTQSVSQSDSSPMLSPPTMLASQPLSPRTPDEESDAILAERQRARELIQAAFSQARSDEESMANAMNAPPPAQARGSMASTPAETTGPPASTTAGPSSDPMSIEATSPLGSGIDQAYTLQNPLASLPGRQLAPLPRRSGSPPASDQSPGAPLPASGSIGPAYTADSQTERQTMDAAIAPLLVPRRILVQGIVAQSAPSPSGTPTRPSTPAVSARSSEDIATGASLHDAASTTGESVGDSGFWGELPGAEALEMPSQPAQREADHNAQSSDSGDTTWDDAVAELLRLPVEESGGTRARGTNTPHQDGVTSGVQRQAALIARLLSVAAAATASTLLPGAITVNGSPVAGFQDPSAAAVGSLHSQHPSSAAEALASAVNTPTRPIRSYSSPSRAGHSSSSDPFSPHLHNGSAGGDAEQHPISRPSDEGQAPLSAASSSSGGASRSPTTGGNSLHQLLRSALASALRTAPPAASGETQSQSPQNETTGEPWSSALPRASTSPPQSPRNDSMAPFTSDTSLPSNAQPNSHVRSGDSAASLIPIAALHSDSPAPDASSLPEGSFERFLAELQRDVSAAITRTQEANVSPLPPTDALASRQNSQHTDLAEPRPLLVEEARSHASLPADHVAAPGPAPASRNLPSADPAPARQPFTFFRAYRFPSRPLGAIVDTAGTTSDSRPEQSGSYAEGSHSPMNPESSGSDTAATPVNNAVTAPYLTATAQNALQTAIVPMLLVGVRSMDAPGGIMSRLEEGESDRAAGASRSGGIDVAASPGTQVDSDGDVHMSDASASVSPSGTGSAPSVPGNAISPQHSYILWIMGGLYPANHPVVLAPSLLGDEALSYEDMLRLAEMMGQHKPPTVSAEEIAKSDLPLIKGSEVKLFEAEKKVLSITSDRCLVCLEDYEPEDGIRILKCQHCFHQECVDRWLSHGANTCPACRTAGVPKSSQTEVLSTTSHVAAPHQ